MAAIVYGYTHSTNKPTITTTIRAWDCFIIYHFFFCCCCCCHYFNHYRQNRKARHTRPPIHLLCFQSVSVSPAVRFPQPACCRQPCNHLGRLDTPSASLTLTDAAARCATAAISDGSNVTQVFVLLYIYLSLPPSLFSLSALSYPQGNFCARFWVSSSSSSQLLFRSLP